MIQAKSKGGRELEGDALWPVCMTNDVVWDSRLSGLLAARGVVPDHVEDDGPVIGEFRNQARGAQPSLVPSCSEVC